MFGFEYYSPTKVIFGKGTENQAGELVKAYGAKKVLIHYGGKSAVKSGLIDRFHQPERSHTVPVPHLLSAAQLLSHPLSVLTVDTVPAHFSEYSVPAASVLSSPAAPFFHEQIVPDVSAQYELSSHFPVLSSGS